MKSEIKRAHLARLILWLRRHGLLLFAGAVLLVSTVLWSYWGASLQMQNSDALVNSLLFKDGDTLQQAQFPGQHSFLLKWPLFWLFKLLGYSNSAFIWTTVVTTLLTISFCMWLLHRIEKRRGILAVWYIALASILALVPAQPYAGGLLPVNMAMLTTRNLEYVIFIASLLLLARQPLRWRSWRLGAALLLMSVLIASDKLFLGMGLVAASAGLIGFALRNRWRGVSLSVVWLVLTVASAAIAAGIVAALNATRITIIANQSANSPYVVNHNLNDIGLGFVYMVGGIATNFGANPAYDATVVRSIPAAARDHLVSVAGPAYILNGFTVLIGFYCAIRLLLAALGWWKRKVPVGTTSANLSVMLILSSLAASVLFVASAHYYVVDSRYLTVWLFALVVAAAAFFSRRKLGSSAIIIFVLIFSASTVLGLMGSLQATRASERVLQPITGRNKLITQALQSHRVSTLVGDYWRVLPIAQQTASSISVTPLQNCTEPRQVLSSKAWQPNLAKHSFAYILSLDKSLTDYPSCSFSEVVKAYGLPNANVLIAGSFEKPDELLMFYDHGAQPNHQANGGADFRSVQPVSLDNLLNTGCENPTILTVVAHQDDDLLFMNPDLQHAVDRGFCLRTIYMTAGDSGFSKQYWLSREQGSEAAYSAMIGKNSGWSERVVKLAAGEYATVASPVGNNKVSLIFMRLPDGNLQGEGFATSKHESLTQLEAGPDEVIHSVDGQSNYNYEQLRIALSQLIRAYEPSEIRTQSNLADETYPDHSDHIAVGRLVSKAYAQYAAQQSQDPLGIPVMYYVGYPIHNRSDNVSGDDLKKKAQAFFRYARYDAGVCSSMQQCSGDYTYGIYLRRQYTNPN